MKLIDSYNVVTDLPTGPDYISPADFVEAVNAVVPLTIYQNYDSTVWISAPGIARYRPLPGSNPTHGKIGDLVETETVMLEIDIPRDEKMLEKLLEVMAEHHAWEEPYIRVVETKVTISQE